MLLHISEGVRLLRLNVEALTTSKTTQKNFLIIKLRGSELVIVRAFDKQSWNRYPPSLHALKDWWDKRDVTWFLRGQTSDKICQCKKSRWILFILDNRKWRTFYLKGDVIEFWVKVIIVSLLDAVAMRDIFTASNSDVKLLNILHDY